MADRAIRLFRTEPLAAGVALTLDAAQAHYLSRVMRARTGDLVRLFNADDGEWRAELAVDRRAVVAHVLDRRRAPAPEPGPTLVVAAIKRPRLELVVEKACELGAVAIQPVTCAHAVVDRVNQERLAAIAREAAEQSERLSVPVIHPLAPLAAVVAQRAATPLFAACARGDAPLLSEAARAAGRGDLLIGPEGGFDAAETAALAAAAGVVPVSLGPRILRAETAAIAGLTVLALCIAR